jgi:DNA-binding winged helix-turn-helix (wHTH) protein/Tol biopolymer transport system component
MMAPTISGKSLVFRFGDVTVREREFAILQEGQVHQVEPKAFRVLLILIRNPNKLIAKEELLNAVWGETAVTENSLARNIAQLRRLLGDDPREARFIETVSSIGYRFICPVEVTEEPAGDLPGTSSAEIARSNGHAPGKLQFGVYELDRDAMELRKHGVIVHLQEQPLRVLVTLVERPGEIVTREELQQRIWGTDIFVDFEQSLNKAVNRVREALNDEAGQPRYVETVPRRGYRFIAPVTGLNSTEQTRPPVLPSSVSDAKPAVDLSFAPSLISGAPPAAVLAKKRGWLALGLSAAVVLLTAISAWFWTHSGSAKTAGRRSLTRLTTNGTSFEPAISRDGKMIAYAAAVGGFNKDIWVRQVAGSKAIQITHEKEGAVTPSFSPDGSQIAYESHGGIYEMPALGGDARLIISDGFSPSYTPDGSTVLFVTFVQGSARLWTVPRMGGTPVAIRPELPILSYLPSPDGNKVLARVARVGRESQDLMRWWTISIPGGELGEFDARATPPGQTDAGIPLDWVSLDRSGQQWVIFSRPGGASTNLFRLPVTSDGNVLSDAEQITSAPAVDFGAAASSDGRIVFSIGTVSSNLWSIPIDTNQGRVTGERQQLTQVEGVRDENVSLSRDGKRAVFRSEGRILMKELETERETQLAVGDSPVISPDGSFVAYTVTEGQKTSVYVVPTVGGAPRGVCRGCGSGGLKGFSADGSRVLAQNYSWGAMLDRIELINIGSGEVKLVLSHPNRSLWHPYYSWDDKWMTFKMQLDPPPSDYNAQRFRIYVTPVEDFVPAGESRWIALTSGEYADDKPQLSPDGNTLYFTSNRDHHTCFWAQRLNPKTKRPEGAPFSVQHLHYQQAIGGGGGNPLFRMELSVARDKIVTNIEDAHSDIWMTQLAPEK